MEAIVTRVEDARVDWRHAHQGHDVALDQDHSDPGLPTYLYVCRTCNAGLVTTERITWAR